MQFKLKLETSEVGLRWANQFYVLLVVSLLLSFALFFTKKNTLLIIFLGLRFLILIIIGYPLSDYMGIELTLITALIFEVGLYLELPYNAIFGLVIIVTILLFQQPVKAWNRELPGVITHDLISFGLYSFALLLISTSLNHYLTKLAIQKDLSERLNGAIMQLTSANLGFQQHAILIERQSKEDERKRLTREVHDTIGYTLTNVIMMMEAATDLSSGNHEQLRELLIKARAQAQEGLNETRRALRILRSTEVHRPKGLRLIYELIKAFKYATGVEVNVEFGNVPWVLGEEMDSAIFRLLQEGLINAFRHGKATKIDVKFWQDDSKINIHIHDNGTGSDEIEEGIGIAGMRERIEKLGGLVSAHNVFDGFEVSARIPFPLKE